jgi:hypothetical protein
MKWLFASIMLTQNRPENNKRDKQIAAAPLYFTPF